MKQCLRTVSGKHLAALGFKDKRIIALEADLKESTQSVNFESAHPERYFQLGIAEQNMVGVAAGFALAGKIPFVHSFSSFISMRACEQVRTSVCYPRLNVKFLVSHGGISTGTAGTTHHAIEDIAIMRAIPNMTVLVPGDAREACLAIEAAVAYNGPVYIRLVAQEAEDVYKPEDKFEIGKATRIFEGDDITIITTGTMLAQGYSAAITLAEKHKIRARLLQMASIKPIDREAVAAACQQTRLLITVEEHNVLGGLGGAVSEIVSGISTSARLVRLGINDHFCDVGSAACLLEKEGLTGNNIVKVALKELSQ